MCTTSGTAHSSHSFSGTFWRLETKRTFLMRIISLSGTEELLSRFQEVLSTPSPSAQVGRSAYSFTLLAWSSWEFVWILERAMFSLQPVQNILVCLSQWPVLLWWQTPIQWRFASAKWHKRHFRKQGWCFASYGIWVQTSQSIFFNPHVKEGLLENSVIYTPSDIHKSYFKWSDLNLQVEGRHSIHSPSPLLDKTLLSTTDLVFTM